MTTVDISGSIRTYLLSDSSIASLVGGSNGRIYTPDWTTTAQGKEPDNPKVAFSQRGGDTGYQRYLFLVEAERSTEARELAILIRDAIADEAIGFPGCNIEFVYKDGGLVDTKNETTKKPQCMFYLRFELYEY